MRLLARGRAANVYALDQDRVLRRYRTSIDVAAEAAIMRHLNDQGYPVPPVHEADGTELVMGRVHGPTMLAELLNGGVDVSWYGELLADLHNRLHRLDVPRWLDPARGDRILHLDLHPDNVILSPDGPVVIDWTNATVGDPRLDVADTAILLRAMGPDAAEAPDIAPLRERLLDDFLAHADHDPVPVLPAALKRRMDDPNVTTVERDGLRRWLADI